MALLLANTYHFSIKQGEPFRKTITRKNKAGNPINLGNTSDVKARVYNGRQVVLELSTDNGGIEVHPYRGQLTIQLEDTSHLPLGNLAYELRVEDIKILEGSFAVLPRESFALSTPNKPTGTLTITHEDGTEANVTFVDVLS